MKNGIAEFLRAQKHIVEDVGTFTEDPVDYPDYAQKVAEAIQKGRAERGILICGSGVGASVALNKFLGIRGGLCHDTYSAHQGVEHDDVNVLCLGARVIGMELALELVKTFLAAKFTNETRHVRRLEKIKAFEKQSQLR